MTNEQLREEHAKMWRTHQRDFDESPGMKKDCDWWLAKLEEAKKEEVEKCQKEMYRSLDEVAQYGKGFVNYDGVKLVNKEDIKVWINALHPHSKDEIINKENI